MVVYTPMPQALQHQLDTIVREISDPQASASNTVFVIREALGQTYAAGHRDGHTLAHSLEWITKDLAKVYEERAATSKAASKAPAPEAAD